ncbi:glycosyltransferase [Thalassospira sp.]|uniref:glycosyltransferase n=1 Tax=Thalassospira sp. TaxID=1912094 RepID=UPI001B0A791C|nr:glycosyltransferase [Thalassospira sp.]MBO6805985.1 glycosyltransferase [Thalassospira sp.]
MFVMGQTLRKTKVVIVIGSLEKGGCETHLLQVMPNLKSLGFDVKIFLLSRAGELGQRMESSGVTLVRPWFQVSAIRRYSRVFRVFRILAVSLQFMIFVTRNRPEIIHFFLPASYWLAGSLSVLAGLRCRVMSRRSLNQYLSQRKIGQILEKKLHKHMHAILGNSAAIVEQLIHDESVSDSKVGLIYNGVEVYASDDSLRSANREKLSIEADTVVLTTIANLIPYKGHADLIEALNGMSLKDRKWKLLLAGRDDGIGQQLQASAENFGISENIVFLGNVDDIHGLLELTDIFVLPSHEEGFSNALLEAMAAGKAVIATDVGGNGEAVIHGESGIIVPPRCPSALSRAIAELIADVSKRAELGEAARRRVTDNFTVDKCVASYEDLYRSLLNKKTISGSLAEQEARKAMRSRTVN